MGCSNTALNEKANSINVYAKTQSDTNYQRKLINPTLTAGQTSFINLATYKSKFLQVSEPVEMIYDDHRIILGINESAVFNAGSYYTRSEVDERVALVAGGYVKSFSFNKVENFTDWVHFGSTFSEYTSATDLTPQNIRFDICTTINTNVPDKGQLQNYTILFKSAPS